MPTIPGVNEIDWFGGTSAMLASSMYWMTIIFISLGLLGVFFFGYWYFSFPYTVTVFPMYGSGKDGIFSVGKPKKNKIKWINKKTAWRTLFPLFNKKEIEPFDSEYIYPGRKIYAFELNEEIIPGRINIDKTEDEIRCDINPVPYYIRSWQSLQHKKNEQEFAKHDFWSDNKMLIITLAVCGLNLAICGFTIWFTYKYAMGGRADIQNLVQAINDFGNMKGVVPG